MIDKEIQTVMDKSIEYLERIDLICRKLKLENEQEFLDWQDKINKISVK